MSTSSTSPIPLSRLSQLTNEVLASVFPPTAPQPYNHALTPSQNTTIINTLLQHLITESSSSTSLGQQGEKGNGATAGGETGLNYKFLVSSTIIQQSEGGEGESGKRGMHSASGAYWNNEKDGMWSFKWEGSGEGEGDGKEGGRGFDVVVSVVWVSVV